MPGPHGGTLSVAGLCSYCETPTRTTCRLCGTPMCQDHEPDGLGICIGCATGRAAE